MDRAIIICAGEATRWNNHLNTPKHLIEIEGERLLDRTVRLLNERGITDIYVVVKELSPLYESKGSKQFKANLQPEENVDADKFLSSKELWNQDGRTLVFYGDCYFTEEAMDTIVNFNKREWNLFCRPNASKVTGTKWGECFAQSFYPEHLEKHEKCLHDIVEAEKRGEAKKVGGWVHYRCMVGLPLNRHNVTTNYIEIDDFTDDFDFKTCYENWVYNRKKYLDRSQDRDNI